MSEIAVLVRQALGRLLFLVGGLMSSLEEDIYTGSQMSQAGLELSVWLRMTLNL